MSAPAKPKTKRLCRVCLGLSGPRAAEDGFCPGKDVGGDVTEK